LKTAAATKRKLRYLGSYCLRKTRRASLPARSADDMVGKLSEERCTGLLLPGAVKRADSEAHRTMLEHMAATWDRIAAEMSEKKQDGKP
jgi:hypothetical protein